MPSSTEYPQPELPRLGHRYGPARILAYIVRPEPPPSSPSHSTNSPSTSSSSSSSMSSSPPNLYPELQTLDHLYFHISPWLPHPYNPLRALERAVSSAVSRHRYSYYDDHPNQHPLFFPGHAALAATDIRASDIRINLRSTERPTVFGDMRPCTSWLRPLSALGEDGFRDVLSATARRREVAEVIVLLRPAVARDEAAGQQGTEDDRVSLSSSPSSVASSDSTGVVHDDDDDDEAPRFQLDHQGW
ncbi:hypothetical protein PG993_008536 [Apiospora rasikravindrae]|uniref:Uncharacterized protein n=1 Tax=Apiospora rasikravindrae TaxID=990691 RepID=A0ABR1T0N0_9PEZI